MSHKALGAMMIGVGAACSTSSSVTSACDGAGAQTVTVQASDDVLCADQPHSLSATIHWTVDGRVTVNGQNCRPWCSDSDGVTGPCVTRKEPITTVARHCQIDANCLPGAVGELVFYTMHGQAKNDLVMSSNACVYYSQ